MDYFYINPKDIHERHATLRTDEHRHLTRVVRKKAGDRIVLVDGEDRAYDVIIRSVGKDRTECEILATKHRLNEPSIDVTLGVSLLRNPARFDFLVEKATELGVRSILPLSCERTIPRGEKHARLEKIALAAMKQSGRAYLPKIAPLTALKNAVTGSDQFPLRLIPHESLGSLPFISEVISKHREATSVLVVIGPEGGFTDGEVQLAMDRGFAAVSLGPRRLRTETAALAAVTMILGSQQAAG